MVTLEDILNKAKNVADAAKDKTGDFVSITKLKMALSDNKREMSATMEGLGRLVYDAEKNENDVTELVQQAIARADELEQQRTDLEKQLYGYQDAAVCAKCGTANAKSAKFCQNCGEALN